MMESEHAADEQAEMNPAARREAVAIGAGRLLLGTAILAATRPALGGLGFTDPSDATVALARLAGGRDIALGLHALSAAGDRKRLREAVAIGALVDLGDAVAFGVGLRGSPQTRRTAMRNAPAGAVAAVAGLWVLRRL
jgi:hypothetical protein